MFKVILKNDFKHFNSDRLIRDLLSEIKKQ